MITRSPYRLTNVIKPGHMPYPVQAVHTCDAQEIIDLCLSCKVKGRCRPESEECALRKIKKKQDRHRLRVERDKKIEKMVNKGMKNKEIQAALGIAEQTLFDAKKRLRERGVIS